MPTKFLTLVSIVVLSLLARFADAAGEWNRMELHRAAAAAAANQPVADAVVANK